VRPVEIRDGVASFTLGFSPVTWRLVGATRAAPDMKDMADGAQERQQTLMIPPGPAYDERHPQFSVETHANVISFYHGDPLTKHRIWTGRDDLSAKVWVLRDEKNLKVRAAVLDDCHVPGGDRDKLWVFDSVQLAFNVPGEKDFWKIDLARGMAGEPLSKVWNAPAGRDKAEMERGLALTVRQDGNLLVYEASFPLKTLGYGYERLRKGVKFNLIVNENDGEGRDGWIQLAPGLGDDFSTDAWPLLMFQ